MSKYFALVLLFSMLVSGCTRESVTTVPEVNPSPSPEPALPQGNEAKETVTGRIRSVYYSPDANASFIEFRAAQNPEMSQEYQLDNSVQVAIQDTLLAKEIGTTPPLAVWERAYNVGSEMSGEDSEIYTAIHNARYQINLQNERVTAITLLSKN